jgi:hypothetical protein
MKHLTIVLCCLVCLASAYHTINGNFSYVEGVLMLDTNEMNALLKMCYETFGQLNDTNATEACIVFNTESLMNRTISINNAMECFRHADKDIVDTNTTNVTASECVNLVSHLIQ